MLYDMYSEGSVVIIIQDLQADKALEGMNLYLFSNRADCIRSRLSVVLSIFST